MHLTTEAKDSIKQTLDNCTSDPSSGLQGLVFVAVDKSGNELTSHVSGKRALHDGAEPMTLETVFWFASCTKMITALAAMQLVEQGKIALDSAEDVYKIAPELKKVQVLAYPSMKLVPREGDITLRKLLSHTAGFGYEFMNVGLADYGRKGGNGGTLGTGYDVFAGDVKDVLNQPLVNQPGSKWEYGINLDWVGIIVERISGMTLDAYFKKHIFKPLGIRNITFFPTAEMRKHITTMLQRSPSGETTERDHLYRRALCAETSEEQSRIFNSGGAGSFGQPKEYVKILATLLNDGACPTTGAVILKKETVDEMFKNQIPEFPDFARNGSKPANSMLVNDAPEAYPQKGNPPQGWGLSWFITIEPGETGRGRNTAWWAGISNQYWWCDREKGVAGMICGQILPFGDMQVAGQWFACEAAVYQGLQN